MEQTGKTHIVNGEKVKARKKTNNKWFETQDSINYWDDFNKPKFGIERLEQTGKTHIVNGEKVKARKKTNNKWFETQDSINYWDDFNKPKIGRF